MNRSEKSKIILSTLKKLYPDAHCELNYSNPLELLIATILSAQCTDKRVNSVTESLFKRFKKPEDYLKVLTSVIENEIRTTGFFRNKAKSIQGACRTLVEKHQGQVPQTMEELVKLPGVGRKTANVVLGNAFNIPGFPCDTHVIRLSNRLGLTKSENAEQVEKDVTILFPKQEWTHMSHRLIWHGRRCCYARKPDCEACPLQEICEFYRNNL
ncbi:MAG: endonuclease III [Deltaproteobacteria bacterium]|nr:MAG: endonuclease III [Deltaproteobacteria bacterium]